MKFISWNVNGLRACEGKGFRDIFNELDADFFCLQETKLQEGQIDLQFPGYESYWDYAEKKGYSGTAIFTRHKPLSVARGLGIDAHDHEGRAITLEFEQFYLVTAYVPNSQDGLRRLDYRMAWEDDFRAPADASLRGYALATYQGFPLGFAKALAGRANNLYPKEWRIRTDYLQNT